MNGMGFQTFMAAQFAGQQLLQEFEGKKLENEQRKQNMQMQQMQMEKQKQDAATEQAYRADRQKAISEADKMAKDGRIATGQEADFDPIVKLQQSAALHRKMAMSPNATPAESDAEEKQATLIEGKISDLKKAALTTTEKATKDRAAFFGSQLDQPDPQAIFEYELKTRGLQAAQAVPTKPLELRNWLAKEQRSGMSATEQISDARQREATKATQDRLTQEHKDNLELRRQMAASAAAAREAASDDRATKPVEIPGQGTFIFDPKRQNSGERWDKDPRYAHVGSTKAQALISQKGESGITAGYEATRALDAVAEMAKGQTSGLFAHVTDAGSVLAALPKAASNKMNTTDQQIYATTVANMGLEVGQLATALFPKGQTQTVVNEFKRMIEAQKGESEITAMYKLVNAADFIRRRIETLPKPTSPEAIENKKNLDQSLAKYPTTIQFIKELQREGRLGTIDGKTHRRVESSLSAISAIQNQAELESDRAKYLEQK